MTDRDFSAQDLTPDELRERARETRDQLAHTVDALAERADVRARAQQKAEVVGHQLRETAVRVRATVREGTPGPVREKTAWAATAVKEHRVPAFAALAGLALVLVLVSRHERSAR
jgi:hypothetical protein